MQVLCNCRYLLHKNVLWKNKAKNYKMSEQLDFYLIFTFSYFHWLNVLGSSGSENIWVVRVCARVRARVSVCVRALVCVYVCVRVNLSVCLSVCITVCLSENSRTPLLLSLYLYRGFCTNIIRRRLHANVFKLPPPPQPPPRTLPLLPPPIPLVI